MKREKPKQIGTCPCPAPGCAKQLEVYRYREVSGRGSMFKGKFYARCPEHGRVIDAYIPASQEHVLDRGEIWGANREAAAAPAPKALVVAAEPVSMPEPRALPRVLSQPAPEPVKPPQPEPTRAERSPLMEWLASGWEWLTKPGDS